MQKMVFTALFPYGGMGGGALGFKMALIRLAQLGLEGTFKILGGIEWDPGTAADFRKLTGALCLCEDMRKITKEMLWKWFGRIAPDVVLFSPPCLPRDGLVLTEHGPRKIQDVEVGMRVLTHQGRCRRVLDRGREQYEGLMYGLRLHGTVDVQEFTAEHPIWLRRSHAPVVNGRQKKRLGQPEFVRASEVRTGDRVGFPIEREEVGVAQRFVESCGDVKGLPRAALSVDLSRYAESEALWFLMGAYLGGGYRRESRYETVFCVGAVDGEFAGRVRSSLLAVGLDGAGDDVGHGEKNAKVRVHARHLSMICGQFGDGSASKKIPAELMKLETRLVEALIDGYRCSNGASSPKRMIGKKLVSASWSVASVSLELLRGIQRLLLRTGKFGAIHVAWPGGPQEVMGRRVQTLPRWEICVAEKTRRGTYDFEDGAVWVRVRLISYREASEEVWNLEVDEDNTFCVPMMATHNCKGASGLTDPAVAATEKYQLMNELALVWLKLMFEAWPDGPKLVLMENVPRVRQRAPEMMTAVRKILRAHKFVIHEDEHDCGVIGGLPQHRSRLLLVGRKQSEVPNLLYQPIKRRVRAIGEVLMDLPLPGDPVAGPLHLLPEIEPMTALRLALIPAGCDWKALPAEVRLPQELADMVNGKKPSKKNRVPFNDVYRVVRLDEPSPCVTAGGTPSAGVASIADPRVPTERYGNNWRVERIDEPAHTVTGSTDVQNGAPSVADPRPGTGFNGSHGVVDVQSPAGTVTGNHRPSSGPSSVADPRVTTRFNGGYEVMPLDEPSKVITGGDHGPAAGAYAMADPRAGMMVDPQLHLGPNARTNISVVLDVNEPSRTVTGATRPAGGGMSIADPRVSGKSQFTNNHAVLAMEKPSRAITGATRPGSGMLGVADPRPSQELRASAFGVLSFEEPAGTITGEAGPSNGAFGVADPRPRAECHPRAYGVLAMEETSGTITGNAAPGGGAFSVVDPRPLKGFAQAWGVVKMDEPIGTITASSAPSNGRFSVADPNWRRGIPFPLIIAADGTWHRPLTLLERAVLQTFPATVDGKPLELEGKSRDAWSIRIGDAIPVYTAFRIAEQMLLTLVYAAAGTFVLSTGGDVWVQPESLEQ